MVDKYQLVEIAAQAAKRNNEGNGKKLESLPDKDKEAVAVDGKPATEKLQ